MKAARPSPWSEAPRTAAWRRLASVVVPIAVAGGCDDDHYTGTVAPDCEIGGTCSSPGTVAGCETNDACDYSTVGTPAGTTETADTSDSGYSYTGTSAGSDSADTGTP